MKKKTSAPPPKARKPTPAPVALKESAAAQPPPAATLTLQRAHPGEPYAARPSDVTTSPRGTVLRANRYCFVRAMAHARLSINVRVQLAPGYLALVLPMLPDAYEHCWHVQPSVVKSGEEVEVFGFNPTKRGATFQEGQAVARLVVVRDLDVTISVEGEADAAGGPDAETEPSRPALERFDEPDEDESEQGDG